MCRKEFLDVSFDFLRLAPNLRLSNYVMSKNKKKLRSKNAFAVISYMINLDSLNEIVGPSEMLKAI